jgi:hypothetical protein
MFVTLKYKSKTTVLLTHDTSTNQQLLTHDASFTSLYPHVQ